MTESKHVNICPNTMQDKSISCSGDREIIRIDNVLTAYITNTVTCDETFQDDSFTRYLPSECIAWQKEAYFRYSRSILLPPASEGWGKVLLSVCQSTPRLGGGVPQPGLDGGGVPQ